MLPGRGRKREKPADEVEARVPVLIHDNDADAIQNVQKGRDGRVVAHAPAVTACEMPRGRWDVKYRGALQRIRLHLTKATHSLGPEEVDAVRHSHACGIPQ